MANPIRFLKLKPTALIAISDIRRVAVFEGGVGIFNMADKMTGWVETCNDEQSEKVADLLDEIVNNPRRAKQPDWSFIVAPDADASGSVTTSARTPAVMPSRGSQPVSTGSNSAASSAS